MSDDPAHEEHAEPVAVAAFTDIGEAEIAQAKLRAYGIEAFVDDQVEGGILPVEGDGSVLVLVRAADASDARGVLADAGDESGDDGDELTAGDDGDELTAGDDDADGDTVT